MKTINLDVIKGCLFGGAIGDAFGYAVAFMNVEQIRELYGSTGITQLPLTEGRALISDDTQMTLFTVNGILNGMTQTRLRDDQRPMERYLHNAYMDWQRTQTQRMFLSKNVDTSCWIYHVKQLHSVRAPGGTCLRALSSGVMGTLEYPINSSKGCGGVMRVAPIGLYFDPQRFSPDDSDLLGAKCAALTHGHQLGFLPAAALTHIIRQIAYGDFSGDDALYDILTDTIKALPRIFGKFEKVAVLQTLLQKAVDLSTADGDDLPHIAGIGEGWVAEEALAIAVYCALKYHDNYQKAVLTAVNHSGDSNSTASITGSIMGTLIGYNQIPTSYVDNLELYELIRILSEDLYRDCSADDKAHYQDEIWQKKYVKADYRL